MGLIALSALSTLSCVSKEVAKKRRELDKFYAFARRELGDLLDGVKVTYTPDLEVVIYTANGRPFKSVWRTSHIAFEKRMREEARLAAELGARVDSEVYGLDGAYHHSTREIMLSKQGTLELRVLAQEIWHAGSDIDYHAARDSSLRRRDKLFSVALGEGALLSAYRGVKKPLAQAAVARKLLQEYNASEDSVLVTGARCVFPPEEIEEAVRIVGLERSLRMRFVIARERLQRSRPDSG